MIGEAETPSEAETVESLDLKPVNKKEVALVTLSRDFLALRSRFNSKNLVPGSYLSCPNFQIKIVGRVQLGTCSNDFKKSQATNAKSMYVSTYAICTFVDPRIELRAIKLRMKMLG